MHVYFKPGHIGLLGVVERQALSHRWKQNWAAFPHSRPHSRLVADHAPYVLNISSSIHLVKKYFEAFVKNFSNKYLTPASSINFVEERREIPFILHQLFCFELPTSYCGLFCCMFASFLALIEQSHKVVKFHNFRNHLGLRKPYHSALCLSLRREEARACPVMRHTVPDTPFWLQLPRLW